MTDGLLDSALMSVVIVIIDPLMPVLDPAFTSVVFVSLYRSPGCVVRCCIDTFNGPSFPFKHLWRYVTNRIVHILQMSACEGVKWRGKSTAPVNSTNAEGTTKKKGYLVSRCTAQANEEGEHKEEERVFASRGTALTCSGASRGRRIVGPKAKWVNECCHCHCHCHCHYQALSANICK